MTTGSKAREITNYSFLVAFANDGIIDEGELALIKRLALRDNILDDEEKQVLDNIFGRLDMAAVSSAVRDEIKRFRKEHQF